MAKTILPYTTVNTLAQHIDDRASQQSTSQIKIEREIAAYCGVGWEAIKSLKYNRAQASLPLALKICEFFGTSMESMYKLREV